MPLVATIPIEDTTAVQVRAPDEGAAVARLVHYDGSEEDPDPSEVAEAFAAVLLLVEDIETVLELRAVQLAQAGFTADAQILDGLVEQIRRTVVFKE